MQNMLPKKDINREKFNSQDFKANVTDGNSFIFYYFQLLQFAVDLGIIVSRQRDAIVSNLTQTVATLASTRPHIISNYLYVVTLYLQSRTNWEAWEELEKIQNSNCTNSFLANVVHWFSERVKRLEEELNSGSLIVHSFDNKEFISNFNYLNLEVNNLKNFTNGELSLKSLHSSQVPVPYFFLSQKVSSNYVETLETTVRNFLTEMNILNKIDANKILREQEKLLKHASKTIENKSVSLENSLDNALHQLKSEYDLRMQKSNEAQIKFDKKYQETEESFRKGHSDLSEEELDEAFEDYLDTLPDEFWDSNVEDPEEIRRWYSSAKEELIIKFEKEEQDLEKAALESQLNNEPLHQYSLENIIKEFALFSLANKQLISYPKTQAEKNSMLMQLSQEQAIPEFISAFQNKLSADDIKYLQSNM